VILVFRGRTGVLARHVLFLMLHTYYVCNLSLNSIVRRGDPTPHQKLRSPEYRRRHVSSLVQPHPSTLSGYSGTTRAHLGRFSFYDQPSNMLWVTRCIGASACLSFLLQSILSIVSIIQPIFRCQCVALPDIKLKSLVLRRRPPRFYSSSHPVAPSSHVRGKRTEFLRCARLLYVS
jgi:hypothetical protein